MLRLQRSRAGPWWRRAGVAVVEYVLLLALLAVAAISTYRHLGYTALNKVDDYGDSVAACVDVRPVH